MPDPKTLDHVRSGISAWTAYRAKVPDRRLDLIDAPLEDLDLSGFDLRNVDMSGANLQRTTMQGRQTRLDDSKLEQADCTGAVWTSAILSRVKMRSARLTDTNLDRVDLQGSDLRQADLCGATLENADLRGADLRGATMNEHTRFHGAQMSGCRMDRFSFAHLGANDGGITEGRRMEINVTDSLATLRSSYSGFWQWLHLASLVVFAFPYARFILFQLIHARFDPQDPEGSMALWMAFLRFVWNGGIDWQSQWRVHWSLGVFVIAIMYNALRFALLYKTKQLELDQESRGTTVKFSLEESRWGSCFKLSKWLLYVNLVVVTFNTLHFLTQRIPID